MQIQFLSKTSRSEKLNIFLSFLPITVIFQFWNVLFPKYEVLLLINFLCFSLLWAADIIWRENILSIRHFWIDYPHVNMTFMFKFFFIVQVKLG